MSNDVRIVKFKKIIEKIWEDLDRTLLTMDNKIASKDDSIFLATIYDYDKLNDYGKVIMEQVSDLAHNRNFLSSYKNAEYRIDQLDWISTFIRNSTYGRYKEYKFIFWALMILAVDDTDKEEHLSLICDFAKVINIDDNAMLDIVQIVRLVFQKETEGFLSSVAVRLCFEKLLKDYGFLEKQEGFSLVGGTIGGPTVLPKGGTILR